MSKLNFDITVNSSDFIEKTEQMRSAIRATALEIEQQGKNMDSSFQQMADSAGLTAHLMRSMVTDMHRQINDAIASLNKIDLGNQLQLSKLQEASAKNDHGILNSDYSQNEAIQTETNSRESLSADIHNQYSELAHLNEQLTKVPIPNAGFEGVISGLDGISGACSAATGMMELFSAENEYLQKIMQKVQSALTVVNGLQEVNMALDKDSAFQINVLGKLKLWWRNITLQAATAQGVETVASSAGTVANLGLAGSFRAIGLAIQSIPVFGWIVAGISALIGVYSLWSSRTKEQQEEQDHLNESIKDFNDNVGNYAAKPIVLIESLSTKFKVLGNDISAQKKFVDDNKKSFDELGVSILNVKDAQQLLIDNKEKFINAQIAKAISLAYTEQMQGVAKRHVEAINAAAAWQNGVNKRQANVDRIKSGKVMLDGKEVTVRPQKLGFQKSEADVLLENQFAKDEQKWLDYDKDKVNHYSAIVSGTEKEMKDLIEKAYSYAQLSEGIISNILPKRSLPDKNDSARNDKAGSLRENQQVPDAKTSLNIKLADSEGGKSKNGGTDLMKKQDAETEKNYKTLLESYQAYTDQRLIIEKKYNEDIASLEDARSEYLLKGDLEKAKQADSAIAQATKNKGKELMGHDYEQLKKSPEYVRAFENLKNTSSETLNSLLNQLDRTKQKAAKVLSPDQLKQYTTAIQNIMNELDQRNPFQALSDKKTELAYAEEELARAQEELNEANEQAKNVKDGGKIEVTSTQYNEKTGKIDTVKSYLTEAQALANVTAKTENLSAAKDKVTEKSGNVNEAEKKVSDQIKELTGKISALGAALGGPAGEIISLIGDIGTFTLMAMSGVKQAADTSAQSISTIEKASVILAIISAAVQLATKVFSMFGANYDEYDKAKEQYDSYVKILDRVIEKQKELVASMKVSDYENANNSYEFAKKLIGDKSDSARILGKERLNSGASAGSHSIGRRVWRDMSNEGWNQAKKALGADWNDSYDDKGRMEWLFDLPAEQIQKLQNATVFWSKLDEDVQGCLQDIIDANEALTETEEISRENLTGTSFDSLKDNFLDALTDMDSSSEDFAENFQKYMQNAVIGSLMKEKYNDRLRLFYEKWSDLTKSGGKLDEKEQEQLRAEYESIVNEALEERNSLSDTMGFESSSSSSQSSTEKGFAAMSQETGDELNGRFTALQISNEEIRNSMIYVLSNMSILSSSATDGNILLTEMKNLAVMSNGHLEDIAKHTKVLLGFGDKLDNIDRNTQKI